MRLDALAPVSLTELNSTSQLLDRVDRKYPLALSAVHPLIELLPARTRVLEIDGRQSFHYSTVYFDTPARDSYLLAARGRPTRFKVRLRHYCDSGEVFLEVKTSHRGRTIKRRLPHVGDSLHSLAPGQFDFISSCLTAGGVHGIRPSWLRPSLGTSYTRTTLLSPDGATRITLDQDLTWVGAGQVLHRPELSIIETKSASSPGAMDRLLWRAGHRQGRISKYATGLAALHPELPTNRWHSTLTRHF
ncbi:polyphosphate polymerase domain-containing protein [Arachnia propionica]|uniref:Polyphosphate polymerase domain-containing protein n=1 Tax=Arachnia propionica TaxID=1750 RepID=A0A3P1TC17_9ACTN|nr:polyphosphate polymerase domain-containing protein [Arachnia propionica]RRD06939.1 polyphosphate polymerase domain-containing protein [Arachnia propionica]